MLGCYVVTDKYHENLGITGGKSQICEVTELGGYQGECSIKVVQLKMEVQ